MTAAGWLVMILAVGGVVGLLAWCIHKVVSTPGSTEHIHSHTDIETPDIDQT